jgi:hypothetical protein
MSNLKKSAKVKQLRKLEKSIGLATDQLAALSYLHGRAQAIAAASPAEVGGDAAAIWDETYRQLRALYIQDGCPADEVTRTAKMLATPYLGYTQQSHDDFILRDAVPWFGTTIYRTSNIGGPTVSDHVDTILKMGGKPH